MDGQTKPKLGEPDAGVTDRHARPFPGHQAQMHIAGQEHGHGGLLRRQSFVMGIPGALWA